MPTTTLTVTREQLLAAVREVIKEVDYDIAKQYDPEYEGREEPDGATFETVTDDVIRHLLQLGAAEQSAAPAGQVILGSFVRDAYGLRGRVNALHHDFTETTPARSMRDDGAGWLAQQEIPVTQAEIGSPWASVLIEGGGALLSPAGRLEVIEPFDLDNPYGALYFGEQ